MSKLNYSYECSKCSNRLTNNDLYSTETKWIICQCPCCYHKTGVYKAHLNKIKPPLHFVKSIEVELYGSIYLTFTNNKVRAITTDVNVKELKQFCFSQPRTNDDLNNFLISK